MKLIDEKLGGTTPLEVILKFPKKEKTEIDTEDEFEDWDDKEKNNDEKYWFTKDKIDRISSVHNYLDSLPHSTDVVSCLMKLTLASYAFKIIRKMCRCAKFCFGAVLRLSATALCATA